MRENEGDLPRAQATFRPNRRRLLIAGAGAVAAASLATGFTYTPSFGRLPAADRLARIKASPNFVDGEFRYPVDTPLFSEPGARLSSLGDFFIPSTVQRTPPGRLPVAATDFRTLDLAQDLLVWLGHSSYYLQLGGRRMLIDPVLGTTAAPFEFMNPAFPSAYTYPPAEMPDIDYMLISHDHWDHLDYGTITALKDRIGQFVVPLGVGAHLEHWGVPPERIQELDWHEAARFPGVVLHAVPARHFSGRSLRGNQSLWAGFVIETSDRRVFYSGDSGYGPHFAEIGRAFGGVDLAILENGQYDRRWTFVHMNPEEAAQAGEDVRAKAVVPCHFGKFSMARHSWDDPIVRLAKAARERPYGLMTPMMGQAMPIDRNMQPMSAWWETVT